jgi:two-component system OmpR family sensor kinase
MLANIEEAFDAETRAKLRLKQFVADASHELRTPIATISGYTELHRKGALEPDPGTDHAMGRIESESRRMKHLVEDLLLLARLDLDPPLERRPVDLSRIVRDAAADSRAIDPERPVEEVMEEGLLVSGDPERLTQVIANLLQNARSHTPPGTPVRIEVGRRNGDIELAVIDRGPGFPPGSLGSVFDRFFRADESRSRKSGGSGLGLAIVEAIARAHGGSARAENLPGAGARVVVRLPALG